jgi:nucleotide-binding universal stress UspA family protein
MFEKLLVAIDGSEPSQRALAAASALALQVGAEVQVLHIAESEMLMGGGGFSGGDVLEGSRGAKSIVTVAVKDLEKAGVKASGTVERAMVGNVAGEILRVAHEGKCSAIVIGVKGEGKLRALLVGSVTNKIVHLSPLPVVVIP